MATPMLAETASLCSSIRHLREQAASILVGDLGQGLHAAGVHYQGEEFVPADPANYMSRRRHFGAKLLGDRNQQPIPGAVSIDVVDLLEAVQVREARSDSPTWVADYVVKSLLHVLFGSAGP